MQKLRGSAVFGANIRSLRLAAGLTQEQVAAKLQLSGFDVSRSIYSQMESGTYNIRVGELAALRRIFGASFDDFFANISDVNGDGDS